MHHQTLLSLGALLQGVAALVPSKCNADNCARAVTGGTLRATRLADCQAFMQCTVTPVAVTVTDTITETQEPATQTDIQSVTNMVTVTVTAGQPKAKRTDSPTAVTNCPTQVPVYASACSGTVRYSSACACGGATQGFTTLEAVTETVTATVSETPADVIVSVTSQVTATETVTVQPPPYVRVANPVGKFHLRVKGGPYNGRLAQGSTGSTIPGWIWHAFGASNAYLTINDAGVMTDNGYQSLRHRIGPLGGEIATPYSPNDQTFGPVTFFFVSNDGGATMFVRAQSGNAANQNKIQICPKDSAHSIAEWYWLASEIRDGCTEVELQYVKL